MDYTHLLIYAISGIAVITFFSTVVAILSRKLRFDYDNVTLVVYIVMYVVVSFLVCREYNLAKALLVNALLGFYKGTAGHKLSDLCKAYSPEDENDSTEDTPIPEGMGLPLTILFAMFLASVGYWIS